jgi:hypothetical protein
LGTYGTPFLEPQRNLSLLAEATYYFPDNGPLRGFSLRAGVGYDHGELLGNNLGTQWTIIYMIR